MDILPLAGNGERDLPLKVEMLLPTDTERAFDAVWRGGDGAVRVAPQEGIVGLHHAVGRDGILNGHEGARLLDLDFRAARGAAGGVASLRDDGEKRLLVEEDLPLGQRRLVASGRGDVVAARHIGRSHDSDNARIGGDSREIHARQPPRGLGGQAKRHVKQAGRLAQVVDVGRGALHLQRRGIMRDRLAHDLKRMFGLVILSDGLLNAEGFKPHGPPPSVRPPGCACPSRRRSPPEP